MNSDKSAAFRLAKLLEEMTGENSSHGSGGDTYSLDGIFGSLNAPSSHFGGEGQTILYLLRLLAQKERKEDRLMEHFLGQLDGPDDRNGKRQKTANDDKIGTDISQRALSDDDGNGSFDSNFFQALNPHQPRLQNLLEDIAKKQEEQKAELNFLRKQMEGTTQKVDDQLERLNNMMDAKVNSMQEMLDAKENSLQKMMQMIELGQSHGKPSSSEASSQEAKARQMKSSRVKEALDQYKSFVDSFNGDFVWKDKGSSVLSSPGNSGWRSCRLDCPVMKVGFIYQWTIEIQNHSGWSVAVGIISSAHQLDVNKSLGWQNGGWGYYSYGSLYCNGSNTKTGLSKFGSGDDVTLTLDLSNVSKDKATGGTLKAKVEGKPKELILFDDIIKQGTDIGMDFKNNNDGDGFFPAVSCCRNTRVKFLGFQSVE